FEVSMAKKIPQDVAFRLAQKARDAEKKAKNAEKKAKDAEKKIKEAEKKVKEAEKKAKEAAESLADDDLDDLDDFDDLDDIDDLDDFDELDDDEDTEDDTDESAETTQDESPKEDDDLDALMKQASSSESSEQRVQRAEKLAREGDFSGALEIWKELTASDADNPENWRGLASVLESRDQPGDATKAQTARDHADRIETQAIAEKTGRKMEDIIADLMDDGILNFSAGSDAKDSE
ncbi:MAG: hypothetical protein VYD88_03725, partial [Candidatus Thermoplasmatota archaeon]|nr:hypothetical protein [Candidatus Thermoplasmatota archaeon]